MHGEQFEIPDETAEAIAAAEGRIVAVGTTSVRALESAAVGVRDVRPGHGVSKLFIRPGYKFNVVDAIVTNFHLPRTTMLLMLAALIGTEEIKLAYRSALDNGYRFLSFGDSMLATAKQ
jgi:S-adenosylmethionine:tRNA ribosyltransferase-isomerase